MSINKIRIFLAAVIFSLTTLAFGAYYGFLRGTCEGGVKVGSVTWYGIAPFNSIFSLYRIAFIVSLMFLITSILKRNLILVIVRAVCAISIAILFLIAYAMKEPWFNDVGEYISFARDTVWFDLTEISLVAIWALLEIMMFVIARKKPGSTI
jgi:hypothetical protein